MKDWFMKGMNIKDICSAVNSAVSSAAILSLAESLHNARTEKEGEGEDLKRLICTILAVIAVAAAVCGIVYALVRILQPRLKERASLRKGEDGEDGEELCCEDPDIADEFEETI